LKNFYDIIKFIEKRKITINRILFILDFLFYKFEKSEY